MGLGFGVGVRVRPRRAVPVRVTIRAAAVRATRSSGTCRRRAWGLSRPAARLRRAARWPPLRSCTRSRPAAAAA
eukprot:scaffold62767_cov64-Phaeocystis_antarctica.AAC.5